jgi:DNA invertase Pin-like site-specific DNA recombinase
MIVGYARVSTLEQNEQLQTDALTKAGCERLFVDRARRRTGPRARARQAHRNLVDP